MAETITDIELRFNEGNRAVTMTFYVGTVISRIDHYYITRKALDGLINSFEAFDEEVYQYEEAHPEWEAEERPRVVNATQSIPATLTGEVRRIVNE